MMTMNEPYDGIKEPLSYRGVDTALLLAALYNNAASGGMGLNHYRDEEMSVQDARLILREMEKLHVNLYFGYINGRSLKVILDPDKSLVTASKYGSYNNIATSAVIDWARRGISQRMVDKFDPEQALDVFLSTTGSSVAKGNVVQLGITQEMADALEETVARRTKEPPPERPVYNVEIPSGYWSGGKQIFSIVVSPPPSGRGWRNSLRCLRQKFWGSSL